MPLKETVVSAPLAAVRRWFVEQVTAIHSVTRPIHVGTSSRL